MNKLEKQCKKEYLSIKMTKKGWIFKPSEAHLDEKSYNTNWIDWLLHGVLWEYNYLTTEPSYYEDYETYHENNFNDDPELPTDKQIEKYKKKLAEFIIKWSEFSDEVSQREIEKLKKLVA